MISVQEFERVAHEPIQAIRAAVALVLFQSMLTGSYPSNELGAAMLEESFKLADKFLECMVKTP